MRVLSAPDLAVFGDSQCSRLYFYLARSVGNWLVSFLRLGGVVGLVVVCALKINEEIQELFELLLTDF